MPRPNILHFFVDQQRFDTIHALNNPVIKTPNLDRIFREGIAFTNAYTPCPVCVAARCSMIYGQYPLHTGCYENTRMPVDDRTSFMERLAEAGYYTHGIGKCHFTPDSYALRGFMSRERQEEYIASEDRDEPYFKMLRDEHYDYVCEPHGIRGEMYYVPQPSQLPERLHPSAWIADRTIDFIREKKSGDAPWYLFSSFVHPHPPFAPPNPWHKLYRAALMPLPNVPDHPEALQTYVNRIQNRYKYRDNGLDHNLIRVLKAYYYACISFVDYQIGRVLDYLEESGQLDQTLILFTSDHGELLGDYNCFGKRTFHDSASRIPMLLRMPGRFEGGRTCDTPVSLVDVASTILGAAHVDPGDMRLDGVDMYDILTGKSNRQIVYGQHSYCVANPVEGRHDSSEDGMDDETFRAYQSTYMAVSREWKYFYSARDNREYLFDKMTDPHETRNKAGIDFVQEDLRKMRESMIAHLREGKETAGLAGDRFKTFPPKALPEDPDTGLLIQDLYTPWSKKTVEGYWDKT